MPADAKPARGAAIATLIAAIIGSAADDNPDNPDNPATDPDNAPTTREDASE